MKLLGGVYFFTSKIFYPTIVLASTFGGLGFLLVDQFWPSFGWSYFLFSLFFHYFIYHVRNSSDYYFYNNLGLSKLNLWGVTVSLGVLTMLIGLLV